MEAAFDAHDDVKHHHLYCKFSLNQYIQSAFFYVRLFRIQETSRDPIRHLTRFHFLFFFRLTATWTASFE